MTLPISFLDLAPQLRTLSSREAIGRSVELAQHAESLGFKRIWYAEHHNFPGIAATAPEILIAHVAQQTKSILLGSGGVMLPNHAPLRIAEVYQLLSALHPGRIELGLGRAPGTDGQTALALRGSRELVMRDDFPQQLAELLTFGRQGERIRPEVMQHLWGPEGPSHLASRLRAFPDDTPLPPVWLLGSSDYSAILAARTGMPFAFAAHFSPSPPEPAMLAYRQRFQAGYLEAPKAMVALSIFCAETEEEAHRLARPALCSFVRLRMGRSIPLPTPEEADRWYPDQHEAYVAHQVLQTQIIGTPEQVRETVSAIVASTKADELMITTHAADHEGRLRSLSLCHEALSTLTVNH